MTDSTIHKFHIPIATQFDVLMAPEAEVLSVQAQRGIGHMWVRVPTEFPSASAIESRRFYLHATGHTVDKDVGRFIGTFQMHDGAVVLHLFEGNRGTP